MSEFVLEARNLKKSFKTPGGEIEVIRDVSLHIGRSESLSIRGESGAGKTTLLNLLTLLERPDQGQVFWSGEEVQRRSNSGLARRRGDRMGLIFQAYYLIPELNTIENVLIARRLVGKVRIEDRDRAEELLKMVGLEHRMRHLTTKLSGGEMQRVALARALMNEPDLVIADEPTGNLDEKTAKGVMEILLSLCSAKGVALVLVTHNPEFALMTQGQLILTEGVIKKS